MSNQRCFIDSCKSFGCIQKAKASAQTQYHGPRYFRSKHNDRGRYQPCINVSSCYQEYKMDQTRWEEMRKTQHVWISQKAKTAKIATVRINWAHSYCCKCCFKKLLWIFFSSFGKSVQIALDVTNLHFFSIQSIHSPQVAICQEESTAVPGIACQVLPKNQLAQLKMSPTHERSITRPFGSHSPFRHRHIDPFCNYVLQVALSFRSLVKRKSSVPGICPPPCYTRRLLRMSMPGDFDFLNFLNFAVSRKKFLQCHPMSCHLWTSCRWSLD